MFERCIGGPAIGKMDFLSPLSLFAKRTNDGSDSFWAAHFARGIFGAAEKMLFRLVRRDLTCALCRACNSATNGTLIGILAAHTAENELERFSNKENLEHSVK